MEPAMRKENAENSAIDQRILEVLPQYDGRVADD